MDDTSTWMKSQFSTNRAANVSVTEGLSRWKRRFRPPCCLHPVTLRVCLAFPNAFCGLFSRWISGIGKLSRLSWNDTGRQSLKALPRDAVTCLLTDVAAALF